MRKTYSMVKQTVINHSATFIAIANWRLNVEILSNEAISTLNKITTSNPMSNAFPAGVSVRKMMLYSCFLHLRSFSGGIFNIESYFYFISLSL